MFLAPHVTKAQSSREWVRAALLLYMERQHAQFQHEIQYISLCISQSSDSFDSDSIFRLFDETWRLKAPEHEHTCLSMNATTKAL